MLLAVGAMLAGTFARGAEETAFEKDRRAILQMTGDFKVTFHFHETLSLHAGYTVKDRPYDEEAYETVKVAEDDGKRIVLQHLLQVEGEVVKHWSQVWTYEDTELLEFQGQRTWAKRGIDAAVAKGTWTQRVTEVTDEPRYEGYGRWVHHEGASEWTSSPTNRPLPRREYTKRDDYDLLLVTNRHTVTPQGWFHEQDNTKQVQREGAAYPLCREVGFNTYTRVADHDFALANDYWSRTSAFWKLVRQAWDGALGENSRIGLRDKVEDKTLSKAVGALAGRVKKGEAVTAEEIRGTLKPYLILSAKADRS
ncbi:hypothetical protein llg_28880 [Luteolibacter sp. LG18]|nr:hypothetical protein llg_28880 [Luteolibacter sp. LG18]